jgi:hypothetical protein
MYAMRKGKLKTNIKENIAIILPAISPERENDIYKCYIK